MNAISWRVMVRYGVGAVMLVAVSGSRVGAQNATQATVEPPPLQDTSMTEKVGAAEALAASENVTLDFKEADIRNILKIISMKSGYNIVATPDVVGAVTITLKDVPWERALDVLLKTYGFGYQKQGNVILVTKLENISKIQAEEQLQTEVINLKYLDAQDAQKVVIPLLSTRGKISILYARGQKGWQFGTFKIGKEETSTQLARAAESGPARETIAIEKNPAGGTVATQVEFAPSVKSKVLVVTDTVSSLDRIKTFITAIDRKPKQVLVETRIMEVNRDKLRDTGFSWGTGANGATSATLAAAKDKTTAQISGNVLSQGSAASSWTPSNFSPLSTGLSGIYPYNAGASFLYQKLTGYQFEALVHLLEEDVDTNTLSAPRIVTLDNQEASILIGFHTPILKSEISGGTSSTDPTKLTTTLDYYQEIGIRLNVVPQVGEDNDINMIVHPSITSSNQNVEAKSFVGTTPVTINYPVIDVREAETQVLMQDGETVVIGGLLKDVKTNSNIGIPVLSKVPLLGSLFKRDTVDTSKIDLVIFITARVVKDGEFTPEEIARMQQAIGKEAAQPKKSRAHRATK